jgi:aryl-alcohol dehydrogenase-like predicted oxidoreductase
MIYRYDFLHLYRGCMGMTAYYGDFDRAAQESESLRTIAKALEVGINFLDTAWIYQSFGAGGGGNFTNEELVGKALKIHGREKFIVATKFGILLTEQGVVPSGTEETIRTQLADSLQRLGTDYIDLYYMHRMDPNTPIEETMRVLKSLVQEGKIRYIGLSECTPKELRRAHAIHPVTAIQMEWSLQTRDIEDTLLPVARELGVGIIAYSPLGRGFLADIQCFNNLDPQDWRHNLPRKSNPDDYAVNKEQIRQFFHLAEVEKQVKPAQLALAWLHAQGNDVFPIPGTKYAERIVENAQAVALAGTLSPEEVQQIARLTPVAQGARYPPDMLQQTYIGRIDN